MYWQSVTRDEPLIPLKIFRDNDFSMSNLGIAVIGFAVTAMIVPVMFYAQAVRGLSPTGAALLVAPMAVASGVLAPFVGKIVDRTHPRPIVGFGFSAVAIALTWLSIELTPTTPTWRLVLPLIVMGVGMAFIWSPLAATATRNLPTQLAGAGSGVYNTTRQVGGVLGSAGIAAFMTSRLGAELPGMKLGGDTTEGTVAELPAFLKVPFSAALSQSLLLPAFVALFGVVAALFLRGSGAAGYRPAPRAVSTAGPTNWKTFTAALAHPGASVRGGRNARRPPARRRRRLLPRRRRVRRVHRRMGRGAVRAGDRSRADVGHCDAIEDRGRRQPDRAHAGARRTPAARASGHVAQRAGGVVAFSCSRTTPSRSWIRVAPPPVAAVTNGHDPWHRSLDEPRCAAAPPVPAPIGAHRRRSSRNGCAHHQVPTPSAAAHGRSGIRAAVTTTPPTYGKHSCGSAMTHRGFTPRERFRRYGPARRVRAPVVRGC